MTQLPRQDGEKLQAAADALLKAALAEPGVRQLVETLERYQQAERCVRFAQNLEPVQAVTANPSSATPAQWQ